MGHLTPSPLKKITLPANLVITTARKLWDVTQIVTEEQEIIAIESTPTLKLVTQISSLPRHSSMLLVGREKNDGELMQRLLHTCGIYHLDFHILDLGSFKKNRKKLEQFEAVCVSRTVEGDVAQYISDIKKLLVFETSIDLTNLSVLKARIIAIQLANSKLDKQAALLQ